jgi:hypothetical protein
LNDSEEVGATLKVGAASDVVEVSELELCPVSVFEGQSDEVLSQQMDPPVASIAQVWFRVKQPIKPPLQQVQSAII